MYIWIGLHIKDNDIIFTFNLGVVPHHQDYYISRIGDPNLNLHLPLASWGGQPRKLMNQTYLQQTTINQPKTAIK